MATTHYCACCLTTFREDPPRCPNLSCGAERPAPGWGRLLEPGDLLDRHYQIGRALAVGGAGITYLAREVDAEGVAQPPELAIKVLYTARASGTYLRRLSNEAQILQDLDHDNIVKCRGFVHRSGHEPYLVTLFEHGGSLTHHVERVGPVSPRVAAGILRQVLLALDVAHQRAVVHRDLKPDNVLLREGVEADTIPHVRVGDFGIAKVSGGVSSQLTRMGAFLGTPEFAAPEQFRSEQPTPATDVFAAGALLYYLLTGRPPFRFSQRVDIAACLAELLEQLPPAVPARADADPGEVALLQDALTNMMAVEPEDRWTVHQVIAHLGTLLGGRRAANHTLDISSSGAPAREGLPPAAGSYATRDDTVGTTPPPAPQAPGPAPSPAASAPQASPVSPASPASPEASEAPEAQADLGSPRPAAVSEVNVPPEPPPYVLEPQGATAGGGAGCVGVLAGLGAAGMVAVLVVGGGLALGVLGLTAWGAGWFASDATPVVRLDPVDIDVAEQVRLRQARALLGGGDAAQDARREMIRALDTMGEGLGSRCGVGGPVVGTLLVDGSGEIVQARLDPGYAGASPCVASALRGRRVPNATRRPAVARVAFHVGGR